MTNGTISPKPLQCVGARWGGGAGDARYGPPGQAAGSPPGYRAESGSSDLRASDAERQATADHLKSHFAAGRLDIDEYEERVQRALAARTRRHLEDLVEDLPSVSGGRAVQARPSRAFLVPVLFAIAVFSVLALAFGTLHWFFVPWWLVPIAFFVLSRHWRRGWRPVYSGPSQ
jgi:hypothetical protein